MISELNQPARIASLECGLVKIPCPPEVSLSNLGASCMNFIAYLAGGRLGTFCFSFLPQCSRGHACSKDSAVLIWDIDLTLAKALPRLFRTTDDQLRASDGKTPSANGLIDLHASGSENLPLSGV